jgi:hypothetical protein
MSNQDLARVVLGLSADVNTLKRDMAKADQTVANSNQKMQRSTEKAAAGMERSMSGAARKIAGASKSAFAGFTAGFVAPLAGLLTLTAGLNGAKAAMAHYSDIGVKAAASGLDSEYFQGIAYAARRAGVEFDALSGALVTYNKNVGLAAEGKGKLATTLQALNPELARNIQLATTQEERIRLAADAIKDAKDSASAAALATTLFGDQGARLVTVFRGGANALDDMIAKAKSLGITVDREVIARADELQIEFDTSAQIVDGKLKQAFINLAPFIVTAVGWAAELARLLGVAADQLKDIDERRFIRPLQNELVGIENERAALMADLRELQGKLETLDPASGFAGTVAGEIKDKAARAEALMQKALEYQERIAQLQGKPAGAPVAAPVATDGSGGTAPSTFDFRTFLDGSGGTNNRRAKAAVDHAEAVKKLVADLKFEEAQLGRTSAEQELYNNLKMAGVDRESKLGQQIVSATESLQAQRDALAANTEAARAFQDAARDATQTLIDGLLEGKDAGNILGDVLKQLGSQLIGMGMGAPVGGIFILELAP